MSHSSEAPEIDLNAVDALIAYSKQCADWLEQDLRAAAVRGNRASPEQSANLQGYRFTALFLQECYDR